MEQEKVKRILKKILAIYNDTPYEGEKQTAKNMLEKILKKHGMTLDDIVEEKVQDFEFKLPKNILHRTLILQIYIKELEKRGIDRSEIYTYKISGRWQYLGGVTCTQSDFIVMSAAVEFYLEDFKTKQKKFLAAYIQKNNFGLKPLEGNRVQNTDPNATDEEFWNMVSSIEQSDNLILITNKGETNNV